MAYCTECGREITEGLTHCDDCGPAKAAERSATGVDADGHLATEDPSMVPVYAGSAISVVGAFLPWATLLGASVSGIDSDGSITLVLGIVAGVLAYARPWDRKNSLGTAAIGVVTLFVALANMTNIAGSGIYVTMVGGVAIAYPGIRDQLE
jgi:hypothetical protein